MAQQLRVQGQETDYLALIFVYLQGGIHMAGFRERLAHHIGLFMKGSLREKAAYAGRFVARVFERISRRFAPPVTRRLVPRDWTYYPMYYPGCITLFQPVDDRIEGLMYDSDMGWKGLAAEIKTYEIPGNRYTIFREPDVRALAESLNESLGQATW
jgi:thioesterase domain-containing protein